MLLNAVGDTLNDKDRWDQARPWLWREEGPLSYYGEPSTRNLFTKLVGRATDMIFTYPHEVSARLITPSPWFDQEDFVMLRTLPHVRFNQKFVGISERGRELGKLFGAMENDQDEGKELADLIYDRCHVWTGFRAGGAGDGFGLRPFPDLMEAGPLSGVHDATTEDGPVDLLAADTMRAIVMQMRRELSQASTVTAPYPLPSVRHT